MASGPITSWQIDGETVENKWQTFFSWAPKSLQMGDWRHEIKKHLFLGRKVMTNIDSILKSRDITLSTKVHLVKNYGFSSSHVWMWELDHKESWAPKNWCFWTVVLEKTLESSLDCKIKPVNPKGNQSWIFTGRTDAEANLQYFGHLMRRADSLEKTLLLGKIEGRRRRGWQRMRCLDGIIDSMDLLLLLSHFSRVWLCATPQTAAQQAPPSLGFSRQEHWSSGHFLLQCMKVKSGSEAAQSCPTLSDPMDCNLSGPSVHGIFQAKVLEWVASAFSTKDLRLSTL